jgi:hypothetical protein
MNVFADQRFDQVQPPYARAEVGALMALLSLPHFPDKFSAGNFSVCGAFISMASNAIAFFAGIGTTFAILTAGFGGGLVFTKAAFDHRPAPNRADPGPVPPVRVILPAYAEAARGIISAPDQTQTDAQTAKPDLQPAQEATKAVAQVEKADVREAERKSRVAARRQAERKARKIAAARAKQRLEAQRREEPAIMAFGGDGPPLFGN